MADLARMTDRPDPPGRTAPVRLLGGTLCRRRQHGRRGDPRDLGPDPSRHRQPGCAPGAVDAWRAPGDVRRGHRGRARYETAALGR